MNYKIYASILAGRLRKILPSVILGFLPKRYVRNNIHSVLYILEYYESHSKKPVALNFLDAKKSFDNVSWKFLEWQLQYKDFGETMIQATFAQSPKEKKNNK